jgi:hypothetical protein
MNAQRLMMLQRGAGNKAVTGLVSGQENRAPVPGAVGNDPATDAVPHGGTQFVQRDLIDDVSDAAGGVKERVAHSLTERAHQLPGYQLVGVAVGKDVITGEPVPQDAEHVVAAVASVIPGGDEKLAQLKQTGVVEKAANWLQTELPKAGLTWDYVSRTLKGFWDSLQASDVLNPGGVWDRMVGILNGFIGRVTAFATSALPKLLELVFEGALAMAGSLGEQVMAIVKKAGNVLDKILQDPIGFARNLIEAVKGGVGQFAGNVLTHLKNGLFGWLTGSLGGVIKLPEKWNLAGIVSMIAEFLGLTWSHLRTLLVGRLGEPVVAGIEKVVGWVKELATKGISAIADKVGDMAEGLMDTVIDGIKDWVAKSVVGAAITKLISMFNPAGAVIQAIIAVYNTVQFFIERAQQIGAFASAVFDSVGAIASGALGDAKNAVENALARSVPVVLGFLARLIGLGDIAAPVRNIMTTVRGAIDKAIDKALGFLIKLAAPMINAAKKLYAKGKSVATGAIDKAKAGAKGLKDKLTGKKDEDPTAATPAKEVDQKPSGPFIYEKAEGGHTIRIRPDLSVVRFSIPTTLTGSTALKQQQEALESVVKRQAFNYPADGLNRAEGPSGHVKKIKDDEGRESMTGRGLGYQKGDHRGHLIGDRFGGSGSSKANFVPMHATLNLSSFKIWENSVATKAKSMANRAFLVFLKVVPTYLVNDQSNAASFRPAQVSATATFTTLKAGASSLATEIEDVPSGPLSNPVPDVDRFDINGADVTALRAFFRDKELADWILKTKQKSPFRSYDDFEVRMAYVLGDRGYLLGIAQPLAARIQF